MLFLFFFWISFLFFFFKSFFKSFFLILSFSFFLFLSFFLFVGYFVGNFNYSGLSLSMCIDCLFLCYFNSKFLSLSLFFILSDFFLLFFFSFLYSEFSLFLSSSLLFLSFSFSLSLGEPEGSEVITWEIYSPGAFSYFIYYFFGEVVPVFLMILFQAKYTFLFFLSLSLSVFLLSSPLPLFLSFLSFLFSLFSLFFSLPLSTRVPHQHNETEESLQEGREYKSPFYHTISPLSSDSDLETQMTTLSSLEN